MVIKTNSQKTSSRRVWKGKRTSSIRQNIYRKHLTECERQKFFSPKSGRRQGRDLLLLLFNVIQRRKQKQSGKKRSKKYSKWKRNDCHCSQEARLYAQKVRNSVDKLLRLISEFSKVAECKINSNKTRLHLNILVEKQKIKM